MTTTQNEYLKQTNTEKITHLLGNLIKLIKNYKVRVNDKKTKQNKR